MEFLKVLDQAKKFYKLGRKSIANQMLDIAIAHEYQKDTKIIQETIFKVIDRLFDKHQGDAKKVVQDEAMKAMIRVARKCELVDECNAHYTKTNQTWKDRK